MSGNLSGRHIVLGVTGGIAVYKSPDLVRRLREAGAEVQVVMTPNAQEFIAPLTFQAVSGQPVRMELWDSTAEMAMGHIELARWADLVLIAPATADCLARLAQGVANDLLTTLCLATEAPVVVAPAMNRVMWAGSATQENVARLKSRGVRMLGPAEGELAEGESGPGRMLEPADIVRALADNGLPALQGARALVTAGPTREAIDPVRYISNRSSGKMGYAVARVLAEAGAEVTLVSGPVALAAPRDVRRIEVVSAEDMHAAVQRELDGTDIFIAAAAVADYASVTVATQKIKKQEATLQLSLRRTPDILAEVAARNPHPFLVGFAAETEQVEAHAREKLIRKGLDMIAANPVGEERGFDHDDNTLTVYWRDGKAELGTASKLDLARRLVALIAEHYAARR